MRHQVQTLTKHDVARRLVEKIRERLPNLSFDDDAVINGATTHDTTQAREVTGRPIVSNPRLTNPALEQLLARAAENVCAGNRSEEFEMELTMELVQASGQAKWLVYAIVDDVLSHLCAEANTSQSV